jgi:hypothetical protein
VDSEASDRLLLLPVAASVPLLSGEELRDSRDTSHRRARLLCSAVVRRQSAYGVGARRRTTPGPGHAATGGVTTCTPGGRRRSLSKLDVELAAAAACGIQVRGDDAVGPRPHGVHQRSLRGHPSSPALAVRLAAVSVEGGDEAVATIILVRARGPPRATSASFERSAPCAVRERSIYSFATREEEEGVRGSSPPLAVGS